MGISPPPNEASRSTWKARQDSGRPDWKADSLKANVATVGSTWRRPYEEWSGVTVEPPTPPSGERVPDQTWEVNTRRKKQLCKDAIPSVYLVELEDLLRLWPERPSGGAVPKADD